MKKIMKLSALCAACFSLLSTSACMAQDSSTEGADAPFTPEKKSMVTLGDSIAAGYGLDDPETERYSALLTESLTDDNTVWEDYNYAVSGDTSTQMLKRLENGRAVRLPSADVITVCIGANHLLQPFVTFYGDWLAAGTEPSAAMGEAFAEMEAAADAGLAEFETQLPLIYDHIRDRNPDAALIFLTVYNPFAHMDLSIATGDETVVLSEYAAEQIGRCNDIIRAFAAKHEDVVIADVYAAFDAEEAPPIIGAISSQSEQYVDPHPNAEGHRLIADAILPLIAEDAS